MGRKNKGAKKLNQRSRKLAGDNTKTNNNKQAAVETNSQYQDGVVETNNQTQYTAVETNSHHQDTAVEINGHHQDTAVETSSQKQGIHDERTEDLYVPLSPHPMS